MPQQRRYQKITPVSGYHYAHITAAGSNQKVGLAGKGTFLGHVTVNQPGSSVTLTLMDGSTVFAVVTLAANMPPLTYGLALDNGLNYTTSGACDLTVAYLDYVE